MTDEPIDPLGHEYELLITERAREDLGAEQCEANDLDGLIRASPWGDIVEKFREMRTRNPTGSEAPLHSVGRRDLFKLDGRDGARAVTWHDVEHHLVWLLAFSSQHDYTEFERRAATTNTRGSGGVNELLPSVDDYEDLSILRSGDGWERVVNALNAAVELEHQSPSGGRRCYRLEDVILCWIAIDTADTPAAVTLCFALPPLKAGIAPSYFEWMLAAAISGSDSTSINPRAVFPPPTPSVRTTVVSVDVHFETP